MGTSPKHQNLFCHHFLHYTLIHSTSHLSFHTVYPPHCLHSTPSTLHTIYTPHSLPSTLSALLSNSNAIFPSSSNLPYSLIHPCVPSIYPIFCNNSCPSHLNSSHLTRKCFTSSVSLLLHNILLSINDQMSSSWVLCDWHHFLLSL